MTIEIDPLTGAPIVKAAETNNDNPPETNLLTFVAPLTPFVDPSDDSPVVVGENKVEELSVEDVKAGLLCKIKDCLNAHGGESNIPFGHDYWTWTNQYRALK